MYKNKTILCIIPARGGSKGLPGKNIRPLLGKPLIGWTIEQAKRSTYIDEIFISTDSIEIANVAESFGVHVSSLRPEKFAQDNTPSYEFVLYTIDIYRKRGIEFDYILLLEPTSPLRKENDIDRAISLLSESNYSNGVVSLGEVHTEHPAIVKYIDNNQILPVINYDQSILRRQSLSKVFFPYGVLYLVRRDFFEREKKFYDKDFTPYFIERWQNYEIDDIYDFICIESIMKYKQKEIL